MDIFNSYVKLPEGIFNMEWFREIEHICLLDVYDIETSRPIWFLWSE